MNMTVLKQSRLRLASWCRGGRDIACCHIGGPGDLTFGCGHPSIGAWPCTSFGDLWPIVWGEKRDRVGQVFEWLPIATPSHW